jgi:hypothetical protein
MICLWKMVVSHSHVWLPEGIPIHILAKHGRIILSHLILRTKFHLSHKGLSENRSNPFFWDEFSVFRHTQIGHSWNHLFHDIPIKSNYIKNSAVDWWSTPNRMIAAFQVYHIFSWYILFKIDMLVLYQRSPMIDYCCSWWSFKHNIT